jgi:hypothetical protein
MKWVVAKRTFGGPEQVLKYLARYSHRVAISNRRLLSTEDGRVTFEWKDYADSNQTKTMTLKAVEFIRRLLLHELPSGLVHIRHFGFLANRKRKKKLALCPVLTGWLASCQRPRRRFPGRPRLRLCRTAPPMPGLQDRSADPHTSSHCCSLRLLAGAPHCRHLMTTVSLPSTKSLTI